MVKDSPTSESWLSAEMEETLDDLFENEFSEPMLSDELRKVYKEKQPSDLDRRTYYENLLRLQIELIKLQDWVEATGSKVLIICEGRDSAGKGGVIKRIV
ncbi:MAG: polyphosphate kinase 2, partial [Marinovum sp.]|nr:polyphosphate kinase 2 [Marinovum sp.]